MSTRNDNTNVNTEKTFNYFKNSKAQIIALAICKNEIPSIVALEKADFLSLLEKYSNDICRNGKNGLELEKLQFTTDRTKRVRNIAMKAFCENAVKLSICGIVPFDYKATNGNDVENAVAKIVNGHRVGMLPNHSADVFVNGVGIECKGFNARLSRH